MREQKVSIFAVIFQDKNQNLPLNTIIDSTIRPDAVIIAAHNDVLCVVRRRTHVDRPRRNDVDGDVVLHRMVHGGWSMLRMKSW